MHFSRISGVWTGGDFFDAETRRRGGLAEKLAAYGQDEECPKMGLGSFGISVKAERRVRSAR